MECSPDTLRAMRIPPKLAAVDLFCGAGGLSYGMKQASIDIVAGIDIDPACKHPFEVNVGAEFHGEDVANISSDFVDSLFPENCVRILAGCAPCQPFSSYSSRWRHKESFEWQLLSKFGELITDLQPEIVTMENVRRLQNHPSFGEFTDTLEKSDYHPGYRHVVRCADYGVPQTRRRLVLLASRLGSIELMPPTHAPSEYVTVRDAIRRMDRIEAGSVSSSDPLHKASGMSEKNLERIRSSRPGGTWRDWGDGLQALCHTKETGKTYPSVYGRMRWDAPAPTVTTQFHGFGNGRFGHPEQDRALSLREGALLQTFPEHYSFVLDGGDIPIGPTARLIGNAVPVKLGEAIGASIVAHVGSFND